MVLVLADFSECLGAQIRGHQHSLTGVVLMISLIKTHLPLNKLRKLDY